MTILIAYRHRGSPVFTHHFRVAADQWAAFYRHCRLTTHLGEYARVVRGEYVAVL